MSWKATAYVKDLQVSPDGKKITRTEKLIMFVLADCYNEDYHQAWPSVQRLATASLMSERHARRILRALEGKGLIQVVRGHGSGKTKAYRFPGYSSDVTREKPDRMSGLSKSKSGQAKYRNRTSENAKPDTATSGELKEADIQATNKDQEEETFYRRELRDLRRKDSIGKMSRAVYREVLQDPDDACSWPGWFRRQVEDVLKSEGAPSSSGNSPGARRKK